MGDQLPSSTMAQSVHSCLQDGSYDVSNQTLEDHVLERFNNDANCSRINSQDCLEDCNMDQQSAKCLHSNEFPSLVEERSTSYTVTTSRQSFQRVRTHGSRAVVLATTFLALIPAMTGSVALASTAGLRSLHQDTDDLSFPGAQPEDLVKCMHEGANGASSKPLTWDRAMKDEHGVLQVQAVWWSKKPTKLPVTIVTQLSVSRLTQLAAQCKVWQGPLSAAVYIPLLDDGGPSHDEDMINQVERARKSRSLARHGTVQVDRAGLRQLLQPAGGPQRNQQQSAEKISERTVSRLKEVIATLNKEGGSTSSDPAVAAQAVTESTKTAAGIRQKLSSKNEEIIHLAELAVSALHAAAERLENSCALSMVLVFEVVGDTKVATLLYPVNQLRNLARLQARTELIAQLDVDMLLSNQMGEWLTAGNNADKIVQDCRKKAVYIMPAFEVHGSNVSQAAMLADQIVFKPKSVVHEAWMRHVLEHFDALRFPQGHNTTNFPRWFASQEAYQINYSYRFEPWLVVHRKTAPWHDARFRGYGNNKIQQVCHLNATGYTFKVHPTAFIVHRAHALTDARKQLIVDLKKYKLEARRGVVNNNTLYSHTKLLFETAKEDMDKGQYVTKLDPATKYCSETLPWYK